MRNYFSALVLFPFALLAQQFHEHVNPIIGTGGHGHTFPGATAPFGMVQLSPDTRIDGSWDGCSGYHYSDNVIYGFSHTHLNGTGVSDFGDIMLMPTMDEPSLEAKQYASSFSHANEKASAGFYAVKLDKHDIDVRLTTSTRVGFHEYTFNKTGQANVILDLNHRDKLLMGEVRIVDNKTIEVLRRSEAWARDQYVYARIVFSKPMAITKVNNNALAAANTTDKFFAGSILALAFSTQVTKGERLQIKVALSPTGYDGAKLNLTELPHWDFNKAKAANEKAWDAALSKIEVQSSNKDELAIFYTALYHTMMQPNIAQDIDRKYRGRDNKIHIAEGFDYYSVFSLWDTFRAAHPLYTLIEKKRTADFINTFLAQYEQGGRLPVWELASNETDCMIGYHSVSVIADAMAKGIKGFDYSKAFAAAKNSAMLDHLGLDAYKKNGFISIDDEHESVSKTLEYAYDDWCIAQMALLLEKPEDYAYFMKRSQSWKNLFDAETGFMRPRKNGGWDTPFEPREVNNNFTEGNAWHYTFFVPQDIPGMITAYGGPEKFEAKLDEMFSAPSQTTGREQVDITGLIGQYAHGNEPSHHMAYLYDFIGKPEKRKAKVDFVLKDFYKNAPDGLIGNEDCGQMSAWYVLSSIGLYTVTPGSGIWETTTPYFDKVNIHYEDGTSATFVKGKPVAESFKQATGRNSTLASPGLVAVPAIANAAKSFQNQQTIQFHPSENRIFYQVNNGGFIEYKKTFIIDQTATIDFYADQNGKLSNTASATFFRKPNNYTIDIKSKYNPQYHAGGPDGLIDGIHGTKNWRKGDWQGYQGQDFECIIDMRKIQPIKSIASTYLQDSRSWILIPSKVEYFISTDGVSYIPFGNATIPKVSPKREESFTNGFQIKMQDEAQARYIKVKATNFGKLPEWHQGYGGDAFIFIDEIEIK
jgi:predicted alpha-1,2-mannosidase